VRPGVPAAALAGVGTGTRRREVGCAALLAVACFVTGRVGTELASLSVVSTIWPAAGVALAGMFLLGVKAWPGVALGGFLDVMSNGVSAPVALGVAAGQTLAPVVAVRALQAAGFDDRLARLTDMLALVMIGGFASNVITATIGTSLLFSIDSFPAGDWPLAWFVWWVGDVIGVLTVAPVSSSSAAPFPSCSSSSPSRCGPRSAAMLAPRPPSTPS